MFVAGFGFGVSYNTWHKLARQHEKSQIQNSTEQNKQTEYKTTTITERILSVITWFTPINTSLSRETSPQASPEASILSPINLTPIEIESIDSSPTSVSRETSPQTDSEASTPPRSSLKGNSLSSLDENAIKKTVKIKQFVSVVLIPTNDEYKAAGLKQEEASPHEKEATCLHDIMWWKGNSPRTNPNKKAPNDYARFKQEAITELTTLMRKNAKLTNKEAIKHLYQPEYDKAFGLNQKECTQNTLKNLEIK